MRIGRVVDKNDMYCIVLLMDAAPMIDYYYRIIRTKLKQRRWCVRGNNFITIFETKTNLQDLSVADITASKTYRLKLANPEFVKIDENYVEEWFEMDKNNPGFRLRSDDEILRAVLEGNENEDVIKDKEESDK